MQRWRTIACLLILALTVPAAWRLNRDLPTDNQPMIEKKYGGWAGVLRLWIREDWPVGSGSVASWINRSIASFEKRHSGVYIQPEYVDAGALSAEGLLPPDLILFPPGEVDAEPLAPLNIDLPVRTSLPADDRAVPVLLGGYMWAYNAELTEGIPNNWRDTDLSVAALPDDSSHLWSAALLALCSSKYSEDSPSQPSAPQGDVELGLPNVEVPDQPIPVEGTLSCRLPEDFEPAVDAWQSFINQTAAAMPVTQREIRRLEALSDQGKGPDWHLAPAGDATFTDQVMYIGMFDQENPEKLALCRNFIAHLLDADCQSDLHRIGAFSVTDADSGYSTSDSLRALEQFLKEKPLVVPLPFDAAWRQDAAAIVREFWRDDREPSAIWARLAERIRQ